MISEEQLDKYLQELIKDFRNRINIATLFGFLVGVVTGVGFMIMFG